MRQSSQPLAARSSCLLTWNLLFSHMEADFHALAGVYRPSYEGIIAPLLAALLEFYYGHTGEHQNGCHCR